MKNNFFIHFIILSVLVILLNNCSIFKSSRTNERDQISELNNYLKVITNELESNNIEYCIYTVAYNVQTSFLFIKDTSNDAFINVYKYHSKKEFSKAIKIPNDYFNELNNFIENNKLKDRIVLHSTVMDGEIGKELTMFYHGKVKYYYVALSPDIYNIDFDYKSLEELFNKVKLKLFDCELMNEWEED